MKKIITSKINWTAFILVLISIQDAITTSDFTIMTTKDWITFSIGGLIIILRSFFTNSNTDEKN